ncbi:MAG TPA: hypothetical protein VHI52_20745 [Verrucomicrobiae bacterium]|nr:hypothetical protein [Verrucomicrobiae bacterium]
MTHYQRETFLEITDELCSPGAEHRFDRPFFAAIATWKTVVPSGY